jgi:hypothetical protein
MITDLLERKDKAIVIAAFGLSILIGVLRQIGIQGPLKAAAFLIVPAGLISIYYIYRAAQAWGGEVARYLTFMGIGMAVFVINMVPHIVWHIQDTPAFFGIDNSFWYIFFHGGIALGFVYLAYGFYLFYQTGK